MTSFVGISESKAFGRSMTHDHDHSPQGAEYKCRPNFIGKRINPNTRMLVEISTVNKRYQSNFRLFTKIVEDFLFIKCIFVT